MKNLQQKALDSLFPTLFQFLLLLGIDLYRNRTVDVTDCLLYLVLLFLFNLLFSYIPYFNKKKYPTLDEKANKDLDDVFKK